MRKSGNLLLGIMPKIIVGFCALFVVGNAWAYSTTVQTVCPEVVCPSNSTNVIEENPITSFVDKDPSRTATCYRVPSTGKYVRIWTLASGVVCPSGFAVQTLVHNSQSCPENIFQYEDCGRSCAGCSNCEDNGTWSASEKAGYQKRTKKTCNMDLCSCETSTVYRCDQGYYGSSKNGTSGCRRCPRADTTDLFSPFGTTDSAGQTTVYSCYIAAGTGFEDMTGSGIYPEQCDYKRDDFVITSCAIGDVNYCTSDSDCSRTTSAGLEHTKNPRPDFAQTNVCVWHAGDFFILSFDASTRGRWGASDSKF